MIRTRLGRFLAALTAIIVIVGVVIGIYFGVVGIKNTGSKNVTQKEIISLILSTKNNPFFTSVEKGVNSENSKKNKYEVRVFDSEDDEAKQAKNISQAKSIGSKAVLINVINSQTAATQLKELFDANIPVVAIDRSVSKADQILQTIATDNKAAAKKLGEFFLKELPKAEKSKILHLQGTDGAQAGIDRGIGFREGIGIASYLHQIRADFNRAKAQTKTATYLTASGNDFKIIFAENDEMALGAIKAIEAASSKSVTDKKPYDKAVGKYYVIGFDGSPDAITSIKNKKLFATVAQQPELIGSTGFATIFKYLEDSTQSISKTVGVDAMIVTKNNVNEF